MQIERTNSDALMVDKLPDGSRVIVDPVNEKVFALNATAGAAWDACSSHVTLSGVAENMRRSFDPGTIDELAREAVLQLEDQKLVKTSGSFSQANRRQFIAGLSAIALPLVVSLTMTDQQAHAQSARSFAPGPTIIIIFITIIIAITMVGDVIRFRNEHTAVEGFLGISE